MFCSHCGKEIVNDAVVCIQCGRAITQLQKPATEIETGAKTVKEVARSFLILGIINIVGGVVVTAIGWFLGIFSVLLGIWEIICASFFRATPPKVTWNPTHVAILEIINVISGPIWSLIIGISNLGRLRSAPVKSYFAAIQSGQTIPMEGTSSSGAMTKKCSQCAETIAVDAQICRFCGHRFNEADVLQAKELAASQAAKLADQIKLTKLQKKRKHRSFWGWVLLSLGGLFLLIFILAYLFPSSDATKSETKMTIQGLLVGIIVFAAPLILWGLFLLRKAKKIKTLINS